jgi:hypothetical protein
MKLDNAYRITLHAKRRGEKAELIQYIEADNMDGATNKAKETFFARLYGFDSNRTHSLEAQKACDVSKVKESLKFGYKGGWATVDGNNEKSIFDMLEEAQEHDFTKGHEITEIHAMYVGGERYA